MRLLAVLLLLGTTVCAQSQNPVSSDVHKDVVLLKQLEQDLLDAFRDGDAEKMGRILDDEFIGRWADGSSQTKEEQLQAIRTGAERHFDNRMIECDVRIFGDAAVVTGIQAEHSVLQGRNGSGTYSFTDVFIRRTGGWKVVASETKKVPARD